jgi:hypothetical protein
MVPFFTRRLCFLIAAVCVAFLGSCLGRSSGESFIRGVTYPWFSETINTTFVDADILHLQQQVDPEWIAVGITWQQDLTDSSSVHKWEETISMDSLRSLVKIIRSRSQRTPKVFLKPLIVIPGNASLWIQPKNIDAWFESYSALVLELAVVAEELKLSALSIGLELPHLTLKPQYEASWRRLISQVRAVFTGQLTYAALCWIEYQRIPFWDDLDWIGIDAYWNLTADISGYNGTLPAVQELTASWSRHLLDISKWRGVAGLLNKPVVFTEVGYPSAELCVEEPSAPPPSQCVGRWTPSTECQTRGYESLFGSIRRMPGVVGGLFVFWWGNPTTSDSISGRLYDCFYSVQSKPSSGCISQFFSNVAD